MNNRLKAAFIGLYLSYSGAVFAESELLTYIVQRMALMHDVAAYKWIHHKPVEDLKRETVVVDLAVQNALRQGISTDSSSHFFELQILAAKEIQNYWLSAWRKDKPPSTAPDLNAQIRPQLLYLGNEIIQHLHEAEQITLEEFNSSINIQGLGAATKQKLYKALRAIQYYPDRLTQILASKQLRIGTTGDYAPFSSYQKSTDTFTGIDIQLAKNLAKSLGVEAVFVHTSWPNLLQDLLEGRYDIAMSGVSRTLARQRTGYFSRAYYSGGKTPIVRCQDITKYNTLDKIDRKNVRLIVNPGGTNQMFIDARIQHAKIRLYPDNRSIFHQIIHFKADVMITDRIEVDYQSALHSGLCAAMQGNLSYQEKAFLMPQDSAWKNYVDTWLDLRTSSGMIAKLFKNVPAKKHARKTL